MKVIKRDGSIVEFDRDKIERAIGAAFDSVEKHGHGHSHVISNIVEHMQSYGNLKWKVEDIQDIAERELMNCGFHDVAKSYIIYRSERTKDRQRKPIDEGVTVFCGDSGDLWDARRLSNFLQVAHFVSGCDFDMVAMEALKNSYEGIDEESFVKAMVLAASSFIELDDCYDKLSCSLMLSLIKEYGANISSSSEYKSRMIRLVDERYLASELLSGFDYGKIFSAIDQKRDALLEYMGLQTLYERYLIKIDGKVKESPQMFWMRVAMGMAINEKDKTERAIEFYDVMSKLLYIPSTPTLFHSGTCRPQLSSCYLNTVKDDLGHIFKCLGDNAQMSKWSGGIGTDWTNIRATGAGIDSTKVESQGVVPFLKIANDVTMAINRSGKRRGAACAYLETWHYDIEDFLDLRKNTGDDRRRTHDMNTANWIPDLFMERVSKDENWTLFSPDECPDLHGLYGKDFDKAYSYYESKATLGHIKLYKTMPARKLWRKMITMLFETGHPWITFKDACNIRSPQDHVGVINSSNLCTEITLNTSNEETAVCNLGSLNLSRFTVSGENFSMDWKGISETVLTAIRMLDNVIDINFYPTIEAHESNIRHRPVGLGVMGLQDVFFKNRIGFDSDEAVILSDRIQEFVSSQAIFASSELARERGKYESYNNSKWDRNIFPIDTHADLMARRGNRNKTPDESLSSWNAIRANVRRYGMRNSNVMAIAPTATISNIAGCFPCIEPIYKNIYVKSNISGEFTVVNRYLVKDLKLLGLWSKDMLDKIKYNDGNISRISEIPTDIRNLYKEAFDIDPFCLVDLTAQRGVWIDQSQSHNVFMRGTSGERLSDLYMYAWRSGLKTTYYLRTLAATQIEKSTLDAGKFGYTQKREYLNQGICGIDDPGCESCQ